MNISQSELLLSYFSHENSQTNTEFMTHFQNEKLLLYLYGSDHFMSYEKMMLKINKDQRKKPKNLWHITLSYTKYCFEGFWCGKWCVNEVQFNF